MPQDNIATKEEVDDKDYIKQIYDAQERLWNSDVSDLYIPPQLKNDPTDSTAADAFPIVDTWLQDPQQRVLLLLGDSGAGKTSFSQSFAKITLERLLKDEKLTYIPLFVPLLLLKNPEEALLDTYLKEILQLPKTTITWLKQQPLLMLLDGFDELPKRDVNLYRSNHLYQLKNCKVLISCRSQALVNEKNFRTLFYPWNTEYACPDQMRQWFMAPFEKEQIEAYIKNYVFQRQSKIKENLKDHPQAETWLVWETYDKAITRLLTLKDFITSPFILCMVMEELPELWHQFEQSNQNNQNNLGKQLQLTCLELYERFTDRWSVRQKKKLLDANKSIGDTWPIEKAYANYNKQLAEAMFQEGVTGVCQERCRLSF